jgi:hypothetical protein
MCTGPLWVAAAYLLAIMPADFIMSRQMLLGVKTRAERIKPGRNEQAHQTSRRHNLLNLSVRGEMLRRSTAASQARVQKSGRAFNGQGCDRPAGFQPRAQDLRLCRRLMSRRIVNRNIT